MNSRSRFFGARSQISIYDRRFLIATAGRELPWRVFPSRPHDWTVDMAPRLHELCVVFNFEHELESIRDGTRTHTLFLRRETPDALARTSICNFAI